MMSVGFAETEQTDKNPANSVGKERIFQILDQTPQLVRREWD
jgi:hypothetical protein